MKGSLILNTETILTLYSTPINSDLTEIMSIAYSQHITPDKLDEIFKMVVNSLIRHDKNLPRRRMRKHYKPYWNEELSRLKKEKVIAYKSWKSKGRPRDSENILYITYKANKKNFIKKLRLLHKACENDEITKVIKSPELIESFFGEAATRGWAGWWQYAKFSPHGITERKRRTASYSWSVLLSYKLICMWAFSSPLTIGYLCLAITRLGYTSQTLLNNSLFLSFLLFCFFLCYV